MRLYTICIQQHPVAVVSAGADLPLPDWVATDPELMKTLRMTEQIRAQVPDDVKRAGEFIEIDQLLDTWLGNDLRVLEHNGQPLWTGDRNDIAIREARIEEADQWFASRREAVSNEDVDAGDADWVHFLVGVSDPTDEAVDEDDD
jgi:hypothetical protein